LLTSVTPEAAEKMGEGGHRPTKNIGVHAHQNVVLPFLLIGEGAQGFTILWYLTKSTSDSILKQYQVYLDSTHYAGLHVKLWHYSKIQAVLTPSALLFCM